MVASTFTSASVSGMIVELGGRMELGDGAVVDQIAAHVAGEDFADADHAEMRAFGGAQRAEAAAAVDRHALAQREQDLLVPGRGDVLVAAVDEADRRRAVEHGGGDVALRRGAATDDPGSGGDAPLDDVAVERRAGEQRFHRRASLARSARGPSGKRRAPGTVSRSETSALATAKPRSPASSGTTIAEPTPIALRRDAMWPM